MKILAIDPGSIESGVVELSHALTVQYCGIWPNDMLLRELTINDADVLVTEYMEPQGMPVSKESMRTIWWTGRFRERWNTGNGRQYAEVTRRQVKLHVCGQSRAKDSNIRQALLDRYPATGGGKTQQVGTKARPGPLFGMRSHTWAALAVGITYLETVAWKEAA